MKASAKGRFEDVERGSIVFSVDHARDLHITSNLKKRGASIFFRASIS